MNALVGGRLGHGAEKIYFSQTELVDHKVDCKRCAEDVWEWGRSTTRIGI